LPIFEFERKSPRIGLSSFVNETATIIGDVSIGERCFVGAGAVLRGDYGRIEIGDRTSIQENVVLHARSDDVCRVGNDVQVGHASVLHNCEIMDFAVIGLGSRICDFAKIGRWAIIGEGAVVSARSIVPDEKVAVGVPAKIIRDVTQEDKVTWGFYKEKYAELTARYRKGLKRVEI